MRQLTVVIPTYNEADNLAALTAELWALPLPDLRILIVDDGSMSVIHREGKLGLGTAYITGFKQALSEGAQAIAQMDADFSHSPEYLPDFLTQLDQYDAVLGSRYVPGGSLDERWGIGRLLLSAFGNFYARTILGLKVMDATGGFRVWRRETLAGMPLDDIRSNGYVFQVEMDFVAQRLGYQIVERPIYFEDRRIGQSKMSFRIQIEAALRVWQVLMMHRHLTPQSRRTIG